jgi:hypothetical protein
VSIIRRGIIVGAATLLAGCGLYVPEIRDFANQTSQQQLIQSIIYNVTCEAQDAIDGIYHNPDHPRQSTFLDTWGVQINLNLQVEEKSTANPTVNWLPPSPTSSVFNLAGTATGSADATRQDKTNSYFTVAELRKLGACPKDSRPGGILLMQSDLGLYEWLNAQVIAADTHKIQYSADYSDGPFKTNVLSHEVKFDVTTSGSITPGWKLSRVLINQTGTFLSATRDRTNDLTITLGPTIPAPKIVKDRKGNFVTVSAPAPSNDAYTAALASQIGLAVANALRGNVLTIP